MRIKASELEGVDLDYWVAVCKGLPGARISDGRCLWTPAGMPPGIDGFSPTTDWRDCGPLLEQGKIYELRDISEDGTCGAFHEHHLGYLAVYYQHAPIKVAICRAFVAACKGEEFDSEAAK